MFHVMERATVQLLLVLLQAYLHLVIIGVMEAYSRKDGESVVKTILVPNDLAIWEPSEAHEFIALEDTIFITFIDGLRGGEDFEKDTVRLDTPLHEQMGK